MKKILLGLGSVAAVAAPIALVVSCGDKATPNSFSAELNDAGTTLNVEAGSVTQVSAPTAAGTNPVYHMSAYNAAEIVNRLIELGKEIYMKVTKVHITITNATVAPTDVVISITKEIDADIRKWLIDQFTKLTLTSK